MMSQTEQQIYDIINLFNFGIKTGAHIIIKYNSLKPPPPKKKKQQKNKNKNKKQKKHKII